MTTPPPALPIISSRPAIFLVAWVVASALAQMIVVAIIINVGANFNFLYRLPGLWWAVNSATGGFYIGLAQWLVFRYYLKSAGWFLWVPLTTLGAGIGAYLSHLLPIPLDGTDPMLTFAEAGLTGLIIGVVQVPFLLRKLPGLLWPLWYIASSLSWLAGAAVSIVIPFDYYEVFSLSNGVPMYLRGVGWYLCLTTWTALDSSLKS